MRSPFGTYLARPSGHESLTSEAGLMNLWLYLFGIAADIICCQMLCLYSLASVVEAARTILGEVITGKFPQSYALIQLLASQRPSRRRGELTQTRWFRKEQY